MSKKVSVKAWLSIATFALIVLILFLAREELLSAWRLLGQVNLWVLLLLIPAQALAYYATGAMMLDYLKGRNKLKDTSRTSMAIMSLELNFVNHTLPSGGMAGFSYMGWRLSKLGVSPAQATMAQIVRYGAALAAFVACLAIAVLIITIDSGVNRWLILASSSLVSVMVFGGIVAIYIIASEKRMNRFAKWLEGTVNALVPRLTLGRVKGPVIRHELLVNFFDELHRDYVELTKDLNLLKKPVAWAFVYMLAVLLSFMVVFWSLGEFINPAVLLVALGVASLAGFAVATPGGAGAYEALMIGFLATAGVASGVAIAGVMLSRVLLMVMTIGSGYFFYQKALIKYGNGQPDLKRK
jgi:putative heme transporter